MFKLLRDNMKAMYQKVKEININRITIGNMDKLANGP